MANSPPRLLVRSEMFIDKSRAHFVDILLESSVIELGSGSKEKE